MSRPPAIAPSEVRAGGLHGYCPWQHLGAMPGVTLTWHSEDDREDGDKAGVTTFDTATVSLRLGQTPAQLRAVLAHELAHVELGPVLEGVASEGEVIVDMVAAIRLVPEDVMRALPDLVEVHGEDGVAADLDVDVFVIRTALTLRQVAEHRWRRLTVKPVAVESKPSERRPSAAVISLEARRSPR